jgi:hypothetical protein
MFSAKFTVQRVDQGWAVRVGPDVLVRFPTRDQALLDVNFRIRAIKAAGGEARYEIAHAAAVEDGAICRPDAAASQVGHRH